MCHRLTKYAGKDDLGLLILLPLPPECWDCRCAPLCLVRIRPCVWCMPGKHTTHSGTFNSSFLGFFLSSFLGFFLSSFIPSFLPSFLPSSFLPPFSFFFTSNPASEPELQGHIPFSSLKCEGKVLVYWNAVGAQKEQQLLRMEGSMFSGALLEEGAKKSLPSCEENLGIGFRP